MTSKWESRGEKLVEELQTADVVTIEALANTVLQEIINAYPNSLNSRKKPLSEVRKAVQNAFPISEKQTADYQYFTGSGKGNIERWQHLALKYLTLSKEDWDALGGDARKEYTEEIIQPTLPTIKNMNIEQLELDTETQQIVADAINQAGCTLAEFIQQACKVYAKTITGKTRKYSNSDISAVPTTKLLDPTNKEYKTHPKKIEELTKRAIKAIFIHNNGNAKSQDERWFISGTTINALTGSRVQTVNEILAAEFKESIDSHNNAHRLTAYSNRGMKRDIKADIDLISLIPDGVNLIV